MRESNNPTELDKLVSILDKRYNITNVESINRLEIGQGTINYRMRCTDRSYFIKRYIGHENLAEEAAGIELSEIASAAGVRTARIIPNIRNQWIDQSSDISISLWEWVEGQVITDNLNIKQYQQVGAVLGQIHNVFSSLHYKKITDSKPQRWRDISPLAVLSDIEDITLAINKRKLSGIEDDFDRQSLFFLNERKEQLKRFAPLMSELPVLGTQIIHSDYSFVNMLFKNDKINAVLDFRPPEIFFISYDLGRIAFYPNTVANNPNWLKIAQEIITAYKDANPHVSASDIIFCGRVALLQLLKSLYGVKQHYLKPALLQDDLDGFWKLRHQTVSIMLTKIEEIEEVLRGI
ncbi:phosphotransferase enzyme family protein [Pectobacterium polaris]|uniref:phosphotransferase enzyme family protein n=1 Tax=Pectobacterium polaris TaxID=2042057 RepID=UPI001CF10F8F|nr:phosphotransferase [Pectobacterium polaris]MCA6955085.1 phosphotransferase [Pectobacterium polaris]